MRRFKLAERNSFKNGREKSCEVVASLEIRKIKDYLRFFRIQVTYIYTQLVNRRLTSRIMKIINIF